MLRGAFGHALRRVACAWAGAAVRDLPVAPRLPLHAPLRDLHRRRAAALPARAGHGAAAVRLRARDAAPRFAPGDPLTSTSSSSARPPTSGRRAPRRRADGRAGLGAAGSLRAGPCGVRGPESGRGRPVSWTAATSPAGRLAPPSRRRRSHRRTALVLRFLTPTRTSMRRPAPDAAPSFRGPRLRHAAPGARAGHVPRARSDTDWTFRPLLDRAGTFESAPRTSAGTTGSATATGRRGR